VLSGRIVPSKGNIYINGVPTPSLGKLRSLIGYVPQDDVMNPLLTVQENITHSAMMRLPADMIKSEKLQ
jgi:ABC transport system ATP-binding/permease protein